MTAKITLINETGELVRVAIYKKPIVNPTLATVAWRIGEPPPHGSCTIPIPASYSVFADYSTDPQHPEQTNYRTNQVDFGETTALFSIDSVTSQDQQATGAVIRQRYEDLVMNEVRIVNNYGVGVRTHVQKEGDDIYPPQVLWPGAVMMEDIRASFYLAVVGQFTYKGSRLVQEEISLTEKEVLQGGTAYISGSMWSGYSIST